LRSSRRAIIDFGDMRRHLDGNTTFLLGKINNIMDEIFLVKNNPSGYEESPSIIGFTLTEDEAKAVVIKETNDYVTAKILVKKLMAIREAYIETLPELIFDQRKEIPKWKSGINQKEITQIMRNERNKINDDNENVLKSNTQKAQERGKVIIEYLKSQLGETQDCHKYIAFNDYLGSVGITEYYHESESFFYHKIKRIILHN